ATKLLADPSAGVVLSTDAPLARADSVVIAAYGLGTAEARTVMVFTVDGQTETAGEVATGPTLADDDDLLALRASAMPAKATGAVVRVAARLDFDARVAIANRLGVDSVPATASIWGDVADDLAIVADLDDPDSDLPTVVAGWRDAL